MGLWEGRISRTACLESCACERLPFPLDGPDRLTGAGVGIAGLLSARLRNVCATGAGRGGPGARGPQRRAAHDRTG